MQATIYYHWLLQKAQHKNAQLFWSSVYIMIGPDVSLNKLTSISFLQMIHSGNSWACSESSQTSQMGLFAKIVNGWMSLTIFAKSAILNFWLFSECTSVNTSGVPIWYECHSLHSMKHVYNVDVIMKAFKATGNDINSRFYWFNQFSLFSV